MAKYLPIIKTTDAELKGYFFLDAVVKKHITPIFELTRSRRSKNNPNGDVDVKMKKVFDLCEGRKFVLDVTTEPTLSNNQTTAFLDNADGFSNWVDFIKKHQDGSIIPCVHYLQGAEADVRKQIAELEQISNATACRVGIDQDEGLSVDDLERVVKFLFSVRKNPMCLIVDSGFVHLNSLDEQRDKILEAVQKIEPLLGRSDVLVCPSSSFPKSVMDAGYGTAGAGTGEFRIGEVEIFKEVRNISRRVVYSDYGSIHPRRYNDFGRWTPRIDYPLDGTIFFYRFKQEAGGYVTAAKRVVKDSRYSRIRRLKAWGEEEVAAAAAGEPNGKSPSHWIAVRMNLHITRQLLNQ